MHLLVSEIGNVFSIELYFRIYIYIYIYTYTLAMSNFSSRKKFSQYIALLSLLPEIVYVKCLVLNRSTQHTDCFIHVY